MALPAAEPAVAVHAGSFDNADRTYAALGAHVAEREIGVEGAIREHYLVGPAFLRDASRDWAWGEAAAEPFKHRFEVCWPIFRTRPHVSE
ncbi:MAG: hypothetical protein WCB85_03025 [Candidatus Dormiibacterota bacterium]